MPRTASALAIATLALLAGTLPASADHDGYRVVTSTDFDAAHPPVAGVPAEVNYFALDGGVITGHHNAIVAIVSGGAPLASLPFTHEHDSIFNALVTPTRAGPLGVDIRLPPLDLGGAGHPAGHDIPEGDLLGHALVQATAVDLVPAVEAALTYEADLHGMGPSTITFHLADAGGEPLTGYVLATLLTRDPAPPGTFLQAKLSAKEGPATLRFGGPPEGVTLRAVAWPSIFSGPLWEPVVLDAVDLDAAPGPGFAQGSPRPGPLPGVPANPLAPPAEPEHPEGPHLFLSTDPAPMNWVMQTTRANLIAMGQDMVPVRHADFAVRVSDQLGHVFFATEDLHEVDGMAQVDLFLPFPGMYLLEATATPLGGEPLAASRWFEVRAQGTNVVPASVVVEAPGALEVGQPAEFTLGFRRALTGESVPHTDYWLRILRGGVDVFQTKIHTHQGDATPTFAAPAEGEYEVRVATYAQAGGFLGDEAVRVLTLQAQGALPAPEPMQPTGAEPRQTIPGFEALLMLAGAALAISAHRRRA